MEPVFIINNKVGNNKQDLTTKITTTANSLSNFKLSKECWCDICSNDCFKSYQYKCLVCSMYDLCDNCYQNKRFNKEHELSHPMVRFDEPGVLFDTDKIPSNELNLEGLIKRFKNELHEDIGCKNCQQLPLKGVRFKCEQCSDFNLCYDCFKTAKHDKNHQILAIGRKASLKINKKDLKILNQLGQGYFGTVFLAVYKNQTVACKKIHVKGAPSSKFLMKSYQRELAAYSNIKAENVLKMIGFGLNSVSPTDYELVILTEYMPKGSLASLLKNEPDLSFRLRMDIAVNVASGMARIHDNGFIHRDIRPDNILINEKYVAKIGDMGIAKVYEPDIEQSLLGPKSYMPIEFYSGRYSQKLDVFTYGLSLNELYNGKHSLKNIRVKIDPIAPLFTYFIEKCTKENADMRPTSKEIENDMKVMQHAINYILFKKNSKYSSSTNKNQIFQQVYDEVFALYKAKISKS